MGCFDLASSCEAQPGKKERPRISGKTMTTHAGAFWRIMARMRARSDLRRKRKRKLLTTLITTSKKRHARSLEKRRKNLSSLRAPFSKA
jgi:hypothetical protein